MTDDPIRWAEGGGPPGGAELVTSLRRPPPLPPELRLIAHARPRRLAPRRIGAALASAVVLGGLVLWVFRPAPAPSSEPLTEDAIAVLAGTTEDAGATPIGAAVRDEPAAPVPSAQPVVPAERSAPVRRARRVARPDTAEIVASPTDTRVLTLEPGANVAGASDGRLVIQTLPWAHVWIDGRDTGQRTPIRGMRVSAGRHTLTLVTSDGTREDVIIDVRPGETLRMLRQL